MDHTLFESQQTHSEDSKLLSVPIGEDAHIQTLPGSKHFAKFNIFYALSLTTTTAALLVAADNLQWSSTGKFYHLVANNRASVQIVIQVLANLLGLIQVTAICRLINYATRIRFNSAVISLDTLRAWVALSTARIDWDLPAVWVLPLMILVIFTILPAAFWAGAMTPVSTTISIQQPLLVPSYKNISLIRSYPAEAESSDASPFVRNVNGFFTYHAGVHFSDRILSDAASATSSNNSVRQHAKFDDTGYKYLGRSYGMGAATGLGDSTITSNTLATQYEYQEAGYSASVSCIYNTSTALSIHKQSEYLYAVTGHLPDSSPEYREYGNHPGIDDKAIVAISMCSSDVCPRRYLAIVAGSSYKMLNATQCAIDFVPMLFNVSVEIVDRNISVVPAMEIDNSDFERNVTRTAMFHIHDISAIETTFYTSTLGNALNSSITGWIMSHPDVKYEDAALAGLEQAFLAMTDNVLAILGSAQVVVGNFSETANAIVRLKALRFGSAIYIYSIFSVNTLIILAFTAEALRTRGWKKLMYFDYLDARALVVSSFIGGQEFTHTKVETERHYKTAIGGVLVRLQVRDRMVAMRYAGLATNSSVSVRMERYPQQAIGTCIPETH